jgi:ubiquinone/menaquinone biosynthesis C-methylase UbiE
MKKNYDNNLQKQYWYSPHNFRSYDHPIVSFFAKQRLKLIEDIIPLSSCNTALDVGCGNGFSSYYLSQSIRGHVYGGDYSLKMLSSHPMKKNIVNLDILDLPFRSNEFDVVNSWEVLHHIEKPEIAVSEMVRVAKRYLVIFVLKNCGVEKIIFYSKCGCIFPNKTPYFLFNILKKIRYCCNFGISQIVVAAVDG